MSVSELGHHIRLSADAWAFIGWWLAFFPSWNGQLYIPPPPVSNVELQLFTDASAFGVGGWFGSQWFSFPITTFSQLAWTPTRFSIKFWELFALVIAVFTWTNLLRS